MRTLNRVVPTLLDPMVTVYMDADHHGVELGGYIAKGIRPILVEGPLGSGKIARIELIARNEGFRVVHISPMTLQDELWSLDIELDTQPTPVVLVLDEPGRMSPRGREALKALLTHGHIHTVIEVRSI